MKASDYIIKFFGAKGVSQVFCVAGGAAAHLLESIRTSSFCTIFNYHEQACAMAADGYFRVSKKPALVLVTSGPGATNLFTGVVGAWQDGVPMIVLSGQVSRNQTITSSAVPLRQLGIQETDVVPIVKNFTNYATQVNDVKNLRSELEKAWNSAMNGRMGPVWLDIPIDVQAMDVVAEELFDVTVPKRNPLAISKDVIEAIARARRPLVVAGHGIHLSNYENEFTEFIRKYNFPVVCTWNATDLFPWSDPLYMGSLGLFGERAGNLAVQNADLLLVIGSRLSIPCVGYNRSDFAPKAIRIMVDLDSNEINKKTLDIHHSYTGDLRDFISQLVSVATPGSYDDWFRILTNWKEKYPVLLEPHTRNEQTINSYDFISKLGKVIKDDVIVTDMGTSFTCTMQSLRNNGSNRLFTSSALCSMGFGLPGAIGAYMADLQRRVICIAGDGGMQMNIQELQTLVTYNLPIKIIVLNNNGYLAISLMQDNLFGKRFGADMPSPDFTKLAQAYGIQSHKLNILSDTDRLADILSEPGPALIEVNMTRDQLMIPRVMSRRDEETGQIVSGRLDAMFPYIKDIR